MSNRDRDESRQHGWAGGQPGSERPVRRDWEGDDEQTGRLGYDPRYNTTGRRHGQDVRQFGGDRGYGDRGDSAERSYGGQSGFGRQGAFNAPGTARQPGQGGYGTYGSSAGRRGSGGVPVAGEPGGYRDDTRETPRSDITQGSGVRGYGAGHVGGRGHGLRGYDDPDRHQHDRDDRGGSSHGRPSADRPAEQSVHRSGVSREPAGTYGEMEHYGDVPAEFGHGGDHDWSGSRGQGGYGDAQDQSVYRRVAGSGREPGYAGSAGSASRSSRLDEFRPRGDAPERQRRPMEQSGYGGYRDEQDRGGRTGGEYPQHIRTRSSFGGWSGSSSHQQRGPKGYKRSDERLHDEICQRISQSDHIDASDVTVNVQEGHVTLDGTLPSRSMKFELEELVDTVMGVTDIDNRIRMNRDQPGDRSSRQQARSGSSGGE